MCVILIFSILFDQNQLIQFQLGNDCRQTYSIKLYPSFNPLAQLLQLYSHPPHLLKFLEVGQRQPLMHVPQGLLLVGRGAHFPPTQVLPPRKTDFSHFPAAGAEDGDHDVFALMAVPPEISETEGRGRLLPSFGDKLHFWAEAGGFVCGWLVHGLESVWFMEQSEGICINKMDFNDISQQWINENEDLKEMSTPIELIDFPLQRMSRCTATEFKLLSFMTQTQYHVDKLYKNPEQFPLNRNPAFMAFNPTRVRLGNDDSIDNYINANMISVAGKRVVATQGPLTVTIYNFWRMVQQYEIGSIFMLCNLIEKGQIKCDRYFPQIDTNNGTLVQKDFTIRLLEDVPHPSFPNIKIKKIQLTNTLKNSSREVTHYHMTNWPDGRSPKQCQGVRFLLDKIIADIQNNAIPVVHCSAGVGRTGTLIAMAHLKLLIASNQPLSVFNEIRKMKEQRWGMVYTNSQYDYLYEYADHEIVKMQNGILSAHSEYSSDEEEGDETK